MVVVILVVAVETLHLMTITLRNRVILDLLRN